MWMHVTATGAVYTFVVYYTHCSIYLMCLVVYHTSYFNQRVPKRVWKDQQAGLRYYSVIPDTIGYP